MSGAMNNDDGQDFDLNLAPIIDCFTVLIAYLLVSASFISLAVFDVGVAVSGEGATPNEMPKDPPYSMSLQLNAEHFIEIKITGGPNNLNVTEKISAVAQNRFDLINLKDRLAEFKVKYQTIEDVSISADESTNYRDIINVIETTKEPFPKVFLSGEQVTTADKVSSNPNENPIQ